MMRYASLAALFLVAGTYAASAAETQPPLRIEVASVPLVAQAIDLGDDKTVLWGDIERLDREVFSVTAYEVGPDGQAIARCRIQTPRSLQGVVAERREAGEPVR